MSNNVTKNSSLQKLTKLHYLLFCMFVYFFNCLLINLFNSFLQLHLLLPCLCKFRFNFYFLFSFFLYYILPSIFILLFLSPPLFLPFRVLPYIICSNISRWLYLIFISVFSFLYQFFLYLQFFSLFLHVYLHTHKYTQGSKWSG